MFSVDPKMYTSWTFLVSSFVLQRLCMCTFEGSYVRKCRKVEPFWEAGTVYHESISGSRWLSFSTLTKIVKWRNFTLILLGEPLMVLLQTMFLCNTVFLYQIWSFNLKLFFYVHLFKIRTFILWLLYIFFRKEVRARIHKFTKAIIVLICGHSRSEARSQCHAVLCDGSGFITTSRRLTHCRISNLRFLTTRLSEEWSDFPHWGRPNRIWCEPWPWALLYCLPIFHITLNLDLLKSTANLSLFYIQMSTKCARNFPTQGSDANVMLLVIKWNVEYDLFICICWWWSEE